MGIKKGVILKITPFFISENLRFVYQNLHQNDNFVAETTI
jgi:hypothetical protein